MIGESVVVNAIVTLQLRLIVSNATTNWGSLQLIRILLVVGVADIIISLSCCCIVGSIESQER